MNKKKESAFTAGYKVVAGGRTACVNKNGVFHMDAHNTEDAKKKADSLNRQFGMPTLYS